MFPAPPVRYYPAEGDLRPRNRPRVIAGALAALAALGLPLIWWFFVHQAAGQRVERWVLRGAEESAGWAWSWAQPALDAVSIGLVVVATGVAILIAIIRRRWVLAIQVALLVGGANATTQLLKDQLPRPHLLTGWTGPNSLPSGHTTVAASVSAAMLIAVPRRWRPLIAILGTLWTIAAGNSTIAQQWHRPSDVVAAVLVVFIWGAAICALSSRWSLDVPARPDASMSAPASYAVAGLLLAGGAVALAVGGFALRSLLQAGAVAPEHGELTAYGGGMAGAAGATAVLFGLLLLIRQATACPRHTTVTRVVEVPQPVGARIAVSEVALVAPTCPPAAVVSQGMEYQWPTSS